MMTQGTQGINTEQTFQFLETVKQQWCMKGLKAARHELLIDLN